MDKLSESEHRQDQLHDLRQRLLMSMRTSQHLAELLLTHVGNLEHCAALAVDLQNHFGTPRSECSPSVTTETNSDMSGPADTTDTLRKKLVLASLEPGGSVEQLLASTSTL